MATQKDRKDDGAKSAQTLIANVTQPHSQIRSRGVSELDSFQ
jgi:hypothetical protein